jgi:diguanylate cyclase (GGDEF)-like protein/PAS domain S-box-containing protein
VSIEDMAAQAAMYRLMVENTIDIIIRYDAFRRRIYVSPSSREILGYEPDEMLRSQASAVIHPEDFPRIDPLFLAFGPSLPRLQLTFRMRRKDGVYIWVESQYRYLAEDGGSLAVLRDITARKHAEDMLVEANDKLAVLNSMLRTRAQQDGLTGLINRRHFDEIFDEEFRRARRQELPLSVLLLDVDRFKAFNDRYGHLAGDACLRKLSSAVQAVLQRPGDQAARYGGEELAVLLPATDTRGAGEIAERIRHTILALQIVHFDSDSGIVTVSIGASSMMPWTDEVDPMRLIDAADRALYRAKSAGRNCVVIAEAAAIQTTAVAENEPGPEPTQQTPQHR